MCVQVCVLRSCSLRYWTNMFQARLVQFFPPYHFVCTCKVRSDQVHASMLQSLSQVLVDTDIYIYIANHNLVHTDSYVVCY